jgi:hypothetical protein
MRSTLLVLTLIFSGCTADVSDLDDLKVDSDACDPRADSVRGTDLELQFVDVTPHVNQDMFFAITVGAEERSVEALLVLSTLDDPDLHLVVKDFLPGGTEPQLAFWADSNPPGFNEINDDDQPIDHQWTRPVCPDGKITFTHTTPFQSVQGAATSGAIFDFIIPTELQRAAVFNNFDVWVRVILLDDDGEDVQTRAFFRWAPLVDVDPDDQRAPPTHFQVGGNALGEPRGAIDTLSTYRIEFVIDVDDDGVRTPDDFFCTYTERAPDDMTWTFVPDLSQCDEPDDFDPRTFEP